MALFDTLHVLSDLGMPDLVSANSPHESIVFWLLARHAAGLGLLAYVLLPDTPVERGGWRRHAWLAFFIGVAAVSYALRVDPGRVPTMYVAGEGLTPVKVALEWGVFGLYLGIAGLLFVRRQRTTHCDVPSLLLALLLMAAGELFFIVYVQVSSTANLLGHPYKVFAYYFLYRTIYAEAVGRPFRQMRHMLTHDELTQLPNRTAFSEEGARAVHDRCGGVLMLLNLDCFQNVNDALGHGMGDQLLIAVASRIGDQMPDTAFVARFSGDEQGYLFSRPVPPGESNVCCAARRSRG